MNVPADLRPLIGKRELRYSLQTGYLGTAKSRARVIAGQVQLLFQEMRRNHKGFMKLSDQQIQDMVTIYLERSKAAMDQPFGLYDGDRPFDDSASLTVYLNGLDEVKRDILGEMATGVRNCKWAALWAQVLTFLNRPTWKARQVPRDNVLIQGYRLEPCADSPCCIQKIEVAAADAVALHMLQCLEESSFLFHAIGTGHSGRPHATETQLIAIDLEASYHAVAAAAPGDTHLFDGKHQVRFALLRGRSHGFVVQAHKLPVGATQGAVR
jgi:hypothetical protein